MDTATEVRITDYQCWVLTEVRRGCYLMQQSRLVVLDSSGKGATPAPYHRSVSANGLERNGFVARESVRRMLVAGRVVFVHPLVLTDKRKEAADVWAAQQDEEN